ETEDVVQREAAALQEADLAGLLPLTRGRRTEAASPDGFDVRGTILARGAEARGDRLVVHALGTQRVRELQGTEAPRLGADRLLREARVRKPAALGEIVQQDLEVLAFGRDGCQLAAQLGARMLAPRKKTHGP